MAAEHWRLRLLGPLEVVIDGSPRPVSGSRRKAVLAVLGLHPGQAVSAHSLINIVWGSRPPATALNSLQSHVSSLRGDPDVLAPIVTRPPGYVLDITPAAVDAAVAEKLIRQRRGADPQEAAARLRQALALWRDRALADIRGSQWIDEQGLRLEDLRLDGVQALTEIRLSLGEHALLVPELEALTERYPFREHVHRLLMLALYGAGRQADALRAYRRLQRSLSTEHGLDPSQPLRDLERAILKQDPELRAGPAPPPPVVPAVPALLPPSLSSFAGREAELSELEEMLAAAPSAGLAGRATVVVAISGAPGVGKTALAVHWAHRKAAEFPDGQLYANLRGFDPSGEVARPGEILRAFLEALGLPADRIPASLDAQTSLFRSTVANKRLFVLLDNARDAAQVRPLLPGSPGTLVLITSRNQLHGLVTEGALALRLELPSLDDARAILTRRIGGSRASAEPAALDAIIDSCARLPLALAIVASRGLAVRGLSLAGLASQLSAAAPALTALDSEDPSTDLRAVMSWSYQALSPEAARLFRAMGLSVGPDFSAWAAASLAGLPLERARSGLSELTRMSLLTENHRGRFGFHDLLRAYAMELAQLHDTESARRAGLDRWLDHYLHTAFLATMQLSPHRAPTTLGRPAPGAVVGPIPGREEAIAWFAQEHQVIAALVTRQPMGLDGRTWRLACAMLTFLEMRGEATQNLTIQLAALQSAQALGDLEGMAFSHRGVGGMLGRLGRFDEAAEHTTDSVRLFEDLGDDGNAACGYINLCWIASNRKNFAEALEQAEHAFASFEAAGRTVGQAHALSWQGWCAAQLGDLDRGITDCRQALKLFADVGEESGQAGAWDSLGYIHFQKGDQRQAVECYAEAITGYRAMGHRYNEAEVYARLGDGYRDCGDVDAARRAWRTALELFEGLDHAGAQEMRDRLAS